MGFILIVSDFGFDILENFNWTSKKFDLMSLKKSTYTYEGVLQFMYEEFKSMENERQEWELEKQDMKVSKIN
jgi:hypothetical protein